MTVGPVELAVRASISPGMTLATPSRGKPFQIDAIDTDGVTLLLGRGQWQTPIRWACLEGIVEFLRGRGWVQVGQRYDVEGDPGTLDAYLKQHVNRAVANWLAIVLEQADVVELDRSRPLRVRLHSAQEPS